MAYFNLDNLIEQYPNAFTYHLIGRRGCGKSFSVKLSLLRHNVETGKRVLWLGRYKEDIAKEALATLFDDVFEYGGFREIYNEKFGLANACLVVKGRASTPVIWIADDIDGQITLVEPFVHAYALKDAERFKRGVWHDKIDRLVFDEVITTLGYLAKENILIDKFCGSLARSTNSTLQCYFMGNPDNNISLAPLYSNLPNLDYDKMKPNSIITFDTQDATGTIHKNNVIFCKIASEGDDVQEFISSRATGVFSTLESQMAITGHTKHNRYNVVNVRDFSKDFNPAITIKVETPISTGKYNRCLYATLGVRNNLPTLLIHRHDSFDKCARIFSAYNPLNVNEPAVYRLNFIMHRDIAEMLNKAIYGLQVFTDDENTAQTFFNIRAENATNPYLLL